MEYLYFLLFALGIMLYLFTLFALSKNDFVLLRRGVMQRDIFDVTFISFISGFVVARVFFILDSFQFTYFNPIQFFHLILYPGLSIFGFIMGVMGVVAYVFLRKKAFLRATDLFVTSIFWIFLMYVIFGLSNYMGDVVRIIHVALSLVLFVVFVRLYRHFSLKDGSGGMLALMYICLSYVLLSFDVVRQVIFYNLSFSQIFGIFIFILLLVLFVIHQFFKEA